MVQDYFILIIMHTNSNYLKFIEMEGLTMLYVTIDWLSWFSPNLTQTVDCVPLAFDPQSLCLHDKLSCLLLVK